MFCRNCGTALNGDETFCPNCQSPVGSSNSEVIHGEAHVYNSSRNADSLNLLVNSFRYPINSDLSFHEG